MTPFPAGKAIIVIVGADPLALGLDRECGEVRVGHKVARGVDLPT